MLCIPEGNGNKTITCIMFFRFLLLVCVCTAFPLQCPAPAQWLIRARGLCPDPSKYSCLKNDLINGYSENCTISDFNQPGKNSVLRGGLDADICSQERYHPWPIKFYTNLSTNCIFRKSVCSEEGQVVSDHGNRNTDTTCGCDYTRGYVFLAKLRNPCVCVPSEEDCSCYLKKCLDHTYLLSPDYDCIPVKMNTSIAKCQTINRERVSDERNTSYTEEISRTEKITKPVQQKLFARIIVTTIFICFIFVYCISVYCFTKQMETFYCEATTIARDFPPIQEHITEEATLERTVNLFSNPKESSWEKSGFHHPLTEASQNIDAKNTLGEIINYDTQRKNKLLEISTEIHKILEKDENLRDVMNTEFANEILDIHHQRKGILENECPIVVAGEVSAGKSSLINLLVGRSILPERQLACTSTICRLRNSKNKQIVLTDYDDKETTIPISKDEEHQMEDILETYVGRRSNPNRCKYVDIDLPIPMLQSHATIVDTPGVGKNKTGHLFKYLPNAIAFIYVINAGNAGGVENDDWLQQIIEYLHEQQKNGHMHDFRPETTMFVCNKWDQVRPKEQDEVFQFIINKLKSDWPNFDENLQIFKLSAVQEKEQMDKHLSPSVNYDYFVSGIRRMIPATLEAKVVRHARRQMFFVEKMADRIMEKISASEKTMTEKERRRKEAEDRLQHLDKNHLHKIKENAIKKVTEKCDEISQRIVNHLKSLTPEHFTWKCDTLPDDETDYIYIWNKARDLIVGRIKHEVHDWIRKNKDLVDEEVKQVLKEEFKIIEEDLTTITPFARLLTTNEPSSRLQSVLSFSLTYAYTGNLIPFAASPLVLFGIPGITVSLCYGVTSWMMYKFWFNKGSLAEYRSNKSQYMIKWTDDVIKNWINGQKIYELMKPFLKNQTSFVDDICKNLVPQVLEAEKKFVDDIMNDNRSIFDISKKYVPLLCDCQILLGKLDLIFLEYFKNCAVSSLYVHNIEMISIIAEGKLSDVHMAKFKKNNIEQEGAVKTFKMPFKDSVNVLQLSEIYSLRKLQGHPNIMTLFGLSFGNHNEQACLQICMELCQDSLFSIVYKKRSPIPCGSIQNLTDCKDSWKFVTDIIGGICDGLDHIHERGFVHHDLRIENIMINANRQVKLVKIGLTKKGIKDPSAGVSRSEVNMAPEIFLGDLTSREADVYSVGMIIYELWYYRPGFSQPLPNEPTEYEFIVNTIEELKTLVLKKDTLTKGRPDLKAGISPPIQLKDILRKCWDGDKNNRPTPKKLHNLIVNVPIINNR